MRNIILISMLVSLAFTSACEKKEDNDDSTTQYNVLFVNPKKERTYIGTVKGLSACKYTASSYYSHRLWIGKGWDYVCCLRTKEDECAEERKYKEKEEK